MVNGVDFSNNLFSLSRISIYRKRGPKAATGAILNSLHAMKKMSRLLRLKNRSVRVNYS